jgi:signal peptidase I
MSAEGLHMSDPYTPPETARLRDAAQVVRPSPLLAVLLSIVATGSGYYYSGARWRLVWLVALVPALLLGTAISLRLGLPPWGYLAFLLLNVLMWIDTYLQARRADARRPPWPELIGTILFCWVYFTGGATLFRAFVLEPFKVPSVSMAPELLAGDQFIVDKLAYLAGEPERGDVAVFRLPDDPSVDYVMRIVGLPGDVVGITDQGDVELNGSPLPLARSGTFRDDALGRDLSRVREQIGPQRSHWILRGDGYWPGSQSFEVPADSYFMLGDNRENSRDSRRWHRPFVPRDHLRGRAVYRHFSWDPETGWPRLERLGRIGERVDPPAETPAAAGP